jgi:hypothetical protein
MPKYMIRTAALASTMRKSQQPQGVAPNGHTELEHGERQIERVAAEAIPARADDRSGGLSAGTEVPAFHRSSYCSHWPNPLFLSSVRDRNPYQLLSLALDLVEHHLT